MAQNSNMLDRVILALSPARGLGRIEARARAGVLMNYDAAGNGRRLSGWKAPATDADAASAVGRSRLRQLSRDMIRNAPFARRVQSVIANNIVGSGIRPAVVGGNEAAKTAAASAILDHFASKDIDRHGILTLSALQLVVANSLIESGEVLVLRHTPAAGQRKRLPLQLEVLEVDHLDLMITAAGANEVREGIEYNGEGIAVAYHIYAQHPGAARRSFSLKSARVPASDILHIRRVERPGQTRGVPWLAPVMLTLGEMRDYQEAQILKQKMSAMLVGIVNGGAGRAGEERGLASLAPGAILYADEGEDVSFSTPPPVADYEPVMRLGLSAVAVGVGITYESLAGDLSRVNFSSMRAGRLEMDKNIESWQDHILIGQFCEGVAAWALAAYALTRQPGGPVSLTWTAPRRALIDPIKEIPAILKKIEGGLTSLQREQRGLGLDPETIDRERKEDAARLPAPPPPLDPPPQDPPPATPKEKEKPK